FLAAVGPEHELRAAAEKAAVELRERVPAAQRVSVAAELAVESETSADTVQERLNRQADHLDEPVYTGPPSANHASTDYSGPRDNGIENERPRGFFVGANVAYASTAELTVATATMTAKVKFPAVFAAELQAGYRILPFLSVALAPQMLFNLKP